MDINIIFKIVVAIVSVGICIKFVKFITNFIFKIALVVLLLLIFYKLFIRM